MPNTLQTPPTFDVLFALHTYSCLPQWRGHASSFVRMRCGHVPRLTANQRPASKNSTKRSRIFCPPVGLQATCSATQGALPVVISVAFTLTLCFPRQTTGRIMIFVWRYKKLSYRGVTARCVLSVVILPITTQQYRNYKYDKSWPNRWYEVGGLVGGLAMCHKQTDHSRVVYITCIVYTDDLLWRNFLSPQCRNCSRDPDHAHLGNTHSSQD